QTGGPSSFDVAVVAPDGASIRPIGALPITLEKGEMKRIEAFVVIDPSSVENGVAQATFELSFGTGGTERFDFPILGPSGPGQTR
ncbi:MAG: hypothetical protein HKN29_15585, partial [Rhodothermales bacterium]|nr:hypothetical protein [Rhodothermales bacterium]